ncbi:hypothetical protein GX50_08694 [[Emmonsia] crescens]|uniref:Uncharacterized protein n=1 Tax=[Emmonsia] crescens TaxID=73230 RepID=A0A2B7Z3T6_9EURO|nr:hypothetical protein GX50_08694 [Emmonsia crescens]
MGWTSASRRIYRVRGKSSGNATAPKKTLPNCAVYEKREQKWAAEDASEAKSRKFSKSFNKWWNRWRQVPSQEDSGSCVDSDSKGEIKPLGVPGNTPGFDQSVLFHICQSYAAVIKEAVLLSHEKRHLAKSTHESVRDSHEWYHARQSSGEDISLEKLQNPTFEVHRKGQRGRLTRTKEWLVNHRNPSLRSFTSSSLSQSSRTRFSIIPDAAISPLPYHDAPVFELPASTLAELADTSHAKESQVPLRQPPSPFAASIPPRYSVCGSTKSNQNQNGPECGTPDSHKSSQCECQYQSFLVSSVDSCISPKEPLLKMASNFYNEDSVNEIDSDSLKCPSPLVDCWHNHGAAAVPTTRTLPFYGPQKSDSTETLLPDTGLNYGTSHLEKSNSDSHQKIASHTDDKGGCSYLGNETESDSSHFTSTFALGSGGDGHGGEGHGDCDESENNSQDEDDDGNNNRKRKRFKSPNPRQNKRQFACVYHKYDPETYHGDNDRKYLVCSGTSFEYISALRRHLARTHDEYVCAECCRTFESDEIRHKHTQNCTIRLKCSQEDKWASLWRERFRGADVPQSPYWEPTSRPLLPRLNTCVEGFPQQQWADISESTKTCNPSPFNSVSSNQQPYGVDDSRQNPNVKEPTRDTMLPSSVEIQLRNHIEALEKRVSFLEQTLLRFFASGNTANKFPACSLLSPDVSSNNSPNGTTSRQGFAHVNFEHLGRATIPIINSGQPTPSRTPSKEGVTSSMLQPPTMGADSFIQRSDLLSDLEISHISEPLFQTEGHQSFDLLELPYMNPNIDFPWPEIESSLDFT